MTPREFTIVCEENVERTHDERERMALQAIYNAAASNGIQEGSNKNPKTRLPELKELYDRNYQHKAEEAAKTAEEALKKQQEASQWVQQFDLSKI